MVSKIRVIVLSMLLALSFSAPRAEALVGWLISEPITTTIGGAAALGGGIKFVMAASSAVYSEAGMIGAMLAANSALAVLGIGLIVLEDQSVSDVHYKKINDEQAQKLGLTHGQKDAYNANTHIFNAIKDQIASNLNEGITIQDTKLQWEQHLQTFNVSSDAIVGLEHVSQGLMAALSTK